MRSLRYLLCLTALLSTIALAQDDPTVDTSTPATDTTAQVLAANPNPSAYTYSVFTNLYWTGYDTNGTTTMQTYQIPLQGHDCLPAQPTFRSYNIFSQYGSSRGLHPGGALADPCPDQNGAYWVSIYQRVSGNESFWENLQVPAKPIAIQFAGTHLLVGMADRVSSYKMGTDGLTPATSPDATLMLNTQYGELSALVVYLDGGSLAFIAAQSGMSNNSSGAITRGYLFGDGTISQNQHVQFTLPNGYANPQGVGCFTSCVVAFSTNNLGFISGTNFSPVSPTGMALIDPRGVASVTVGSSQKILVSSFGTKFVQIFNTDSSGLPTSLYLNMKIRGNPTNITASTTGKFHACDIDNLSVDANGADLDLNGLHNYFRIKDPTQGNESFCYVNQD